MLIPYSMSLLLAAAALSYGCITFYLTHPLLLGIYVVSSILPLL